MRSCGWMVEHRGEFYARYAREMSPAPAEPVPIHFGGASEPRAPRQQRSATAGSRHPSTEELMIARSCAPTRGFGPRDAAAVFARRTTRSTSRLPAARGRACAQPMTMPWFFYGGPRIHAEARLDRALRRRRSQTVEPGAWRSSLPARRDATRTRGPSPNASSSPPARVVGSARWRPAHVADDPAISALPSGATSATFRRHGVFWLRASTRARARLATCAPAAP
jgi:hypothetical protein